MFDTQFWMEGTIVGSRSGVFKDAVLQKEIPFGVVQMTGCERDAVKVFEINLADGFDMSRYPTGTKIKIPVRVGASKDGRRIYYREVPATETAGAERAKSASEAVRRQPATA